LSFDLPLALRRVRPQRSSDRLLRRADGLLPFVEDQTALGPGLMLDSCVYVDVLQGRAPSALERLLTARLLNHSAVCLAELTHLMGRLDPGHPATRTVVDRLRTTISRIPGHRLTSPSEQAFGQSGMLAGLTMRLGGEGAPRTLQNDAALYFHALEQGFVLVTRNLLQFDLFDQLCPSGRVLFYRRT